MAGKPYTTLTGGSSKVGILLLFAGAVLLLGLVFLISIAGAYWYFLQTEDAETSASNGVIISTGMPQIVISQAPSEGAEVVINQAVTIQVVASDPQGIAKIELFVNGEMVDQVSSSLAQSVPSMAAVFRWVPTSSGFYGLAIRAYNQSGQANSAKIANITALTSAGDTPPHPAPAPSSEPAPTDVVESDPTTESVSGVPLAPVSPILTVIGQTLTVRDGPGMQYQELGQLLQNSQIEVVGRTILENQEQWWQIAFASSKDGVAWVISDLNIASVSHTDQVAIVNFTADTPIPSPPVVPTSTPAPLSSATSEPTPTTTQIPVAQNEKQGSVIRAPAGKTLLLAGNRSLSNHPTRLTLSGGKSVGGGQEFDLDPGVEIEIVLEADTYKVQWSAPIPGGFSHGSELAAVPGQVLVLWVIPEENIVTLETYDELIVGGDDYADNSPWPNVTPIPTSTNNLVATPGKALFLAGNRSFNNEFAVLTMSGGSFAGGQEFVLDANTETPLDLLPGQYSAIWTSPARDGFSAGRDFTVSAGEVIPSWVIPEDGQVFIQFPGQPATQINN